MIPKFRAWHKTWEEMGKVKRIRFDDEGNVTTVLFRGRDLGTNTHADEIELMQSTGLCDKEGTEVFEGDILHHQIQTEYTFIVKYDKDKGRWYGDGLSRTYRIDIAKRFLPHYYKVIGNIYENQELLEVENEN
nr:MAG TPA: YopX protein [Caudoviricetes sp.]